MVRRFFPNFSFDITFWSEIFPVIFLPEKNADIGFGSGSHFSGFHFPKSVKKIWSQIFHEKTGL